MRISWEIIQANGFRFPTMPGIARVERLFPTGVVCNVHESDKCGLDRLGQERPE